MPYKKGDVLTLGEYRKKVLEVLGDIYFFSAMWQLQSDAKRYSKLYGHMQTEFELNENGWSLCPPDQTLLPAEKWVPKEDDIFFSGIIMSDGTANFVKNYWDDTETACVKMLAIGNVHKTSEEAIEWAKKRYNIE